jgi:DNA replicative helicase MCM subunit Mcm2 (Cdc46/Mcm family)
MMNQKGRRLVVDLNDLREYDSSFMGQTAGAQDNIANRLLRQPMEFVPPFEAAIKDVRLPWRVWLLG